MLCPLAHRTGRPSLGQGPPHRAPPFLALVDRLGPPCGSVQHQETACVALARGWGEAQPGLHESVQTAAE
jgi:hypothetical protein